jgi:hypothetical protein
VVVVVLVGAVQAHTARVVLVVEVTSGLLVLQILVEVVVLTAEVPVVALVLSS